MSDEVLAFLLTLAAGFATLLGSLSVLLLHKFKGRNFRVYIAGFMSAAAGVMIFISFVELIQESINEFKNNYSDKLSSTFTFLFFFGGIVIGFLMDLLLSCISRSQQKLTVEMIENHVATTEETMNVNLSENASPMPANEDQTEIWVPMGQGRMSRSLSLDDEEKKSLFRTTLVTGIGLSLHNIPEGIATFTAGTSSSSLGLTLAIAIALHNIPEGMSVAIPAYFSTNSIGRAILYAGISGLAQPIGALLAWAFFADHMTSFTYGVVFALTAGIMVIISFQELLPDAMQFDPKDQATTKGLVIGMIIVAITICAF